MVSIQQPELIMIDTLTEFKNLEKELCGRLDSSIRYFLQKRGISIKENVYVGFDTEYNQVTPVENKLVSSQLAVAVKTLIHIPKQEGYKLSTLDDSSKLVRLKYDSSVFNYKKVESSIKLCVDQIRDLKYTSYDLGMMILSECFKVLKGVSYNEGEGVTVFSFPRTSIQPYIHYGDSFTFNELLNISASLSFPMCEQLGSKLMNFMTSISSQGFSLDEGKESMLGDIYNLYSSFDLGVETGRVLEVVSNVSKPLDMKVDKKVDKKVRRIVKNLPERTSITITKTYYVIGHLTSADLSQLSDFESVKDDLSIVNGSFVTLGKAMKFGDRNVHVRDTMLLAPGGSKGLGEIGKLYPGFEKLTITKADLEDMQGYMQRDCEGFTAYALRDALITLIHAG